MRPIDQRLVSELMRLDDRNLPIAEVYRKLGATADGLGLPRPSYEVARRRIHEIRRARAGPHTGDVALEVAFRVRPPEALLDHIAGTK